MDIQVTKELERAGSKSNRGGQRDGEGRGLQRVLSKDSKAVRRREGKEISQKIRFGDISSVPKRPLRLYVILGEVIPPGQEDDGGGRADSQQGLEKGVSRALRAPLFLF